MILTLDNAGLGIRNILVRNMTIPPLGIRMDWSSVKREKRHDTSPVSEQSHVCGFFKLLYRHFILRKKAGNHHFSKIVVAKA